MALMLRGLGGSAQRLRRAIVKGVRTRSMYSGCGSAECALSFIEKAVDIKQPVHTQHGPAEALSVCLGFSHSIESGL